MTITLVSLGHTKIWPNQITCGTDWYTFTKLKNMYATSSLVKEIVGGMKVRSYPNLASYWLPYSYMLYICHWVQMSQIVSQTAREVSVSKVEVKQLGKKGFQGPVARQEEQSRAD